MFINFLQFVATNDPFGIPDRSSATFLSSFDFSTFPEDPIFWYVVGVFVLLILGKIILTITRKYGRMPVAFEKQLILVQLPKQMPGQKPSESANMNLQQIQEAIGTMDSYYSTIAGSRAQRGMKFWIWGRNDQVSFELVAEDDLIKFYVATPQYLQKSVEQHISAQFPYAYIEEVADYNIFKPECFIEVGSLTFKRDFFLPIKTYKKFESDPLNDVTNILSKVSKEDGVAIQFVLRSAKGKWHKMGPKVSRKMSQGKKFLEAQRESKRGIFAMIFWEFMKIGQGFYDMILGSKEDKLEKEQYSMTHMEQEMAKGMEEKTAKPGMDVNIRIVASSTSRIKSKEYVEMVMSSFSQYNIYEYGNSFQERSVKNKESFINDFIYRNFDESRSCLLNTEEMAGLYHLPLPTLETPKILWLLAKKAPPPIDMPEKGVILGSNFYRGVETKVRIEVEDRMRHLYILGQTGSGKTVIMQNLVIQDIENGDGCCIIDPHGEFVEYVLAHIPEHRIKDVIVFDPSDLERPMAMNLLEFKTEQEKSFVVNETLAIFDKLYDLKATGGPMFEQYMRNALLLIMSDPDSGSTLMEVSRVLADEDFRKYKLSKCDNRPVYDFWTKEAEKAGGEASLANMVPYITSKMTPFIANDIMRPIISQQKSCIDFADVMNNKKILLLNLSKGKIGEMNSNLLGMVVIGKILMAALGRVNIPFEERKDFYLYIDEFQNFITESISIILSEARKYRLSLTMAHQFIAQLTKDGDTDVRDAVFGNVGTKIAYRVGVDDAEIMAKQFEPVFNEYDVINTPKFTAYCKLLIKNENPPAFNLHPYPPTTGARDMAEKIKKLSRLKFGRDRRIAEAEVLERLKRTEQLAEFL